MTRHAWQRYARARAKHVTSKAKASRPNTAGSRTRPSDISVTPVPGATTFGSIGMMSEPYLRSPIALVKAGKMSRRGFVQKMIQLGLTVPLANAMLAHAGVALAQTKFEYKPTKRGGGGALKVLWW